MNEKGAKFTGTTDGVCLLLVFLFQAKYDLNEYDAHFRGCDFKRGSDGYLSGVFVDAGCYVSFADFGLRNPFLVASHGGDDLGVDFCAAVTYNADDEFLPAFFSSPLKKKLAASPESRNFSDRDCASADFPTPAPPYNQKRIDEPALSSLLLTQSSMI